MPESGMVMAAVLVKVPEAASGNVSGTQTLTDAQIADLENGKWDFNVHTAKNKGGEIRGQLQPSH